MKVNPPLIETTIQSILAQNRLTCPWAVTEFAPADLRLPDRAIACDGWALSHYAQSRRIWP
jgi:hypothetical protein